MCESERESEKSKRGAERIREGQKREGQKERGRKRGRFAFFFHVTSIVVPRAAQGVTQEQAFFFSLFPLFFPLLRRSYNYDYPFATKNTRADVSRRVTDSNFGTGELNDALLQH